VVINISEKAAIFIFRDEIAGFFETLVTPYKTTASIQKTRI
jgi:hypothetical protein